MLLSYISPRIINAIEAVVLFFRTVGLFFMFPKYFTSDPPDATLLPFATILKSGAVSVERSQRRWTITVRYGTQLRVTTVLLVNGFSSDKPSLLYHHGAGSTNPTRDFSIIFGDSYRKHYNIFIIWAANHTTKSDYLTKSVDSFLHLQQTFANSVLAYEEIITFHNSHSRHPIVATGSSMGGIVSTLHAFYFGTADWYFPLVAYPNVGEIFFGEAYRMAVANWETRRHNSAYLKSFTVPKANAALRKKVFPVLGAFDTIVPYRAAYDFWHSNGFQITTFPYGHFTPAIMRDKIRRIINDTVTGNTT